MYPLGPIRRNSLIASPVALHSMLPKSFIDEMIRGGGDRLIAGDDKTLRIPAGSFSQAAQFAHNCFRRASSFPI